MDTTTVVRRADLPTAVYFVMRRGAGHEFLFYRAGSAAAAYRPADLPEEAIARARIFYASGISLAISASAADAVFRAMEVARGAGVAIAFDTNYRRSLWPVARARATIHAGAAQAKYVFASQEDAEALTGLQDPDAILDFYRALGAEIVILKQGSAGAILATPETRIRIPAAESSRRGQHRRRRRAVGCVSRSHPGRRPSGGGRSLRRRRGRPFDHGLRRRRADPPRAGRQTG